MNKFRLSILVTLLISCLSGKLSARQSPILLRSDEDGSAGLTLFAGAGYGLVMHSSFGEFVDSYNSYYGSSGNNILESELKSFRTAFGYRFGARYNLEMGVGLGMSYEQFNSHQSVDITGGNKRHFSSIMRCAAFTFGGKKNNFRFDYKIGVAYPVIECSYEYPDGTISTGQEKSLNGVYTAVSFFTGIEAAYKINLTSRIGIEAGVDISGFFMGKYSDEHWDKGEVRLLSSSTSYMYLIPTDVASAYSQPWSSYDDAKVVKAKVFRPNVFLNLCYTIF